MRVALLFLGLQFCFISCKQTNSESTHTLSESSQAYYQEPYRPQQHFSPEEKWMNDPNGLVYHQGKYHLFYQYFPEDIVWGPMHWGHATSNDMVHWEHHPIALYPDENGLIFSGSAVIDHENTSGFGTDDKPAMVAIFTYHNMEKEKSGALDFQTQGIAYSLDNGMTWTKYDGNPVIGNTDIKDFRDPKVFWHEESERWILSLVAGDHAKFYSSSNLKDWEWLSDFGIGRGAHGGVWECPDLFPLIAKETGEEKWVLLISINPGAPNGGSGTQYFVGDFNGTEFTTEQEETLWIDYGRDNYAGVTYNDAPEDQRIFIGWMSNWNYARDTPTETWRSAMTLPRELTLIKTESGYALKSYPMAGVKDLREVQEGPVEFSLFEKKEFTIGDAHSKEMVFSINLSKQLNLQWANETESFSLKMSPKEQKLFFNRQESGLIDFEQSFANGIQEQPYLPEDRTVEVRVVLDASSVEIFIDHGRYIFTNQLFPEKPYTKLIFEGEEQLISNYHLYNLKSIWNEQ